MSYSKLRLKEVVALQKGILERIESDLGEFGPSPRPKYIQEFTDEFQTYDSVCQQGEIVEASVDAQVVWIGDYHALARSREFTADFLRRLADRKNGNIVLGVEVFFGRHQKQLERWLYGDLAESTFLEGIRYSEEWGCDWPSYKSLLDVARELGVPIYGVDCNPRRDLRSIRRRDQGVAQRISKLVQQDPSRTVVVLFGESHLATAHLPMRVRSILEKKGVAFHDVLVLQNIDNIYWQLQERGLEGVNAVRIKPDKYCVFNATPLEKYESFRQYLHECAGEPDDAGDWTRFVHTLVDGMLDFLDVHNRVNLLEDLPKVYSEVAPDQLTDFLSLQKVRPGHIKSALDSLQENGISYIPELNSMFIDHFNLDSAAEETARYIYHFCGGLRNMADRSVADLFFLRVIERALGYFCSKLLDSSRDGIEALGDRVANQIGYNDEFARAIPYLLDPGRKPSVAHLEKLVAAIAQNAGRQKLLSMMSQMLGYALGRRLHRAYLESRISRKEIHALFQDPLAAPEDALALYVELSNRLA